MVSVAANVLPCIKAEIRKCLFKSVFYLFDRYVMTAILTSNCLVLARLQDIYANIGSGTVIITNKVLKTHQAIECEGTEEAVRYSHVLSVL